MLTRGLLALTLAAAPLATAPLAAGQGTLPPPTDQTFTLHAGTQLVLDDAAVELKRTGEPLLGLTPADFVLTEDGVPQTISSFRQSDLPLSVVLLFDTTDTVHPVLLHLAGGAAAVLRHLRPGDEAAVMTFSSHAEVVQPFTQDRMSAVEGIDGASATYDIHEPTFLFEALWAAVAQSQRSRLTDARRVQIWLTDGSANNQDKQRSLARHAPAILHTEPEATSALARTPVIISVLLERSDLHGNGHFGDLEHLAGLTGGPVVPATATDVDTRLAALLDALRARYTLGYRPSQPRPEGTVCHLKLALSPAFFAAHPGLHPRDVVLRSRESYLRIGPAQAP